MKSIFKSILSFALLFYIQAKAQTPNFTINSSSSFSITCANPTVNLFVTSNYTIGPLTYSWVNGSTTLSGTSIAVTNPGQYTVTAYASATLNSTQTVSINNNIIFPLSTVTPSTQNISCTVTPEPQVTLTAVNLISNITHKIISPQLGIYYAYTHLALYSPIGPGTYTYILRNDVNGCETTKQFTVTTTDGYPGYTLSAIQGYTLGCSTKSVTTISVPFVWTAPMAGQPVSFQFLPPGSPTALPTSSTPLTGFNSQTITTPGTWTVCVKDNSNGCITRTPFSVLSNTFGPVLDSLIVPNYVLSCVTPTVTLRAVASVSNNFSAVNYYWSFDVIGVIAAPTVTASANFTASPTNTVVDNFSLTLTDPNNLCTTKTVVTVLQNIFPPKAKINSNSVVFCDTPFYLTNGSTTNVPPTFPNSQPVLGLLWEGPWTQTPTPNTENYLTNGPGVYTLTVVDPNNGCTAKTTTTLTLCVGLPEYSGTGSGSNSITLQPNPCSGHLEVVLQMNTGEEVSVELLNLLGQKIKPLNFSYHESGETKISCELGDINEGVYFVRVRSGNEAFVKKLIFAH